MENKTAMQMLIHELQNKKEFLDSIPSKYNDPKSEGLKYAIEKATQLLTTEKEQIKDAFNKAREWNEPPQKEFDSDAEFYFNQTYQQP